MGSFKHFQTYSQEFEDKKLKYLLTSNANLVRLYIMKSRAWAEKWAWAEKGARGNFVPLMFFFPFIFLAKKAFMQFYVGSDLVDKI